MRFSLREVAAAVLVTTAATVLLAAPSSAAGFEAAQPALAIPPWPGARAFAGDETISAFEKRASASPKDTITRSLLSELFARKALLAGDLEAAGKGVAVAREVLQADSADVRAASASVRCKRMLGRLAEAREEGEAWLAAHGWSTFVVEALFDVAVDEKDFARAAVLVDQLLSRNEDAPTLVRLSRLALHDGDTALAWKAAESAAREARSGGMADHEVAESYVAGGEAALKAGDREEARRHFEAALQWHRDDAAANSALAGLAELDGQPGKALAPARAAADCRPGPGELFDLARLLDTSGDRRAAAAARQRAEALCRLRPEAYAAPGGGCSVSKGEGVSR